MNVLPEVHEYEEGDNAFHDGDKPHPLLQEIPLDASEVEGHIKNSRVR